MKPCDYCNGRGTYDPFTGPTTECPKCNGTGNVGEPTKSWTDEELDAAGFKSHRVFPKDDTPKTADEAAERVRQNAIANAPRVMTMADRLRNSFVDVKFHPGLNMATVRGDIVDVETFGKSIMRITLSDYGTMHDIGMHDVESVKLVGAHAADAQIWPGKPSTKFASGGLVKPATFVSTTIAGTSCKTGDSVEVHTNNGVASARYAGILKAINATTIEVEATHGVDTIPIIAIDRLIVTTITGVRYTTANAPPGTPVYYNRDTGLWTTDKDSCDPAAQAHIFGCKNTLGSDPWVDRNDEVDDYMALRQFQKRMQLGKAYGMGPAKFARANHDVNRFAYWLDGDIIDDV